MPATFGQKTFDTSGSVYGVSATPSYYSAALSGPGDGAAPATKTMASALSVNPAPGSQASVNSVALFPELQGTLLGQPVTWWLLIALLTVVIYWVLHHHGQIEKEVATPRVGIGSIFSITIQAALGIFIAKALTTKYHIPGLSEFFGSI